MGRAKSSQAQCFWIADQLADFSGSGFQNRRLRYHPISSPQLPDSRETREQYLHIRIRMIIWRRVDAEQYLVSIQALRLYGYSNAS